MTDRTTTRRRFLRLGGIVTAAGLAGCNFGSSGGDDSPDAATGNAPGTATGNGGAGPVPSTGPSDGASPGADTAPADTPAEVPTVEPLSEQQTASAYTAVYRSTIDSVVLVNVDGGGQGTGFVFDGSHVVTNAHVVGRASSASVRFSSGEWSEGEVVGVDPHSDLAAIAVEDRPSAAAPLPFVETEPTVGQEVVAIGNPYALNGSLTTGVVSGTDRLIPGPTGYRIPDAVQTDAAVNPGNSGGPLMSLSGRVLAVINSGGGDNIAFGISAALTRRVVPELIESGDYDHAYAGASMTAVTPTIAEANDLPETRGLIVVDVVSGGPADGTLQASEVQYTTDGRVPVGGDVVLDVDGTALDTAEDFWSYLALERSPGESVQLTVLRDGSRRQVSVELGSRPGGRRRR